MVLLPRDLCLAGCRLIPMVLRSVSKVRMLLLLDRPSLAGLLGCLLLRLHLRIEDGLEHLLVGHKGGVIVLVWVHLLS